MTDLYLFLLQQPVEKIDGKIYNAGYHNHSVTQIAGIVKSELGESLEVVVEPTDDLRSYHVSSEKLKRELGFAARYGIDHAVRGLAAALRDGRLPNAMEDPRYYNIRMVKAFELR